MWSKLLDPGFYTTLGDFVLDSQSNIYFTGTFSDTLVINQQIELISSHPGAASFIFKMDIATGQILWKKQLPGAYHPRLSLDAGNAMYLSGGFDDYMQIDAAVITNTACGPYQCQSFYAAKLSPAGNLSWLVQVGNNAHVYGQHLSPEGFYYLTGEMGSVLHIGSDSLYQAFGSWAPFLMRLNGSSGQLDAFTIPENYQCAPSNLSVNAEGDVFWTGFAGKLWMGGDSVIATQQFPPHTYLAKFEGGMTLTGLPAHDINENFYAWPNPTSGKLYHHALAKAEIRVYDISGACIYRNKNADGQCIDLSDCGKGIYFVEARTEEKIYRRKIIKE